MRIDDLNRTPVTQARRSPGKHLNSTPQDNDAVVGSEQSDQAQVSHLAQSLAAPDPGESSSFSCKCSLGSYDVSAQAVANAVIDAHLKE